MTEEMSVPKTLQEAVIYFADEDRAVEFMAGMRWPDGRVKCPRCGSEKVWYIKTRRVWKCHLCAEKKQFSIKVGTVMEDSAISLGKWMVAFWLIANAKNGISSYELHRAIGVTQKTAWFMLHRIRLAMQDDSIEKFSGRVEADETFTGGKARNMHPGKFRRSVGLRGRGVVGKTAVMGLLERTTRDEASRIRLKVTKRTRKKELQKIIFENVSEGSELLTDSLQSYQGLEQKFVHNVIDHAECYAKGHVHTNGLENFWSLLKRGIKGTYVSVEPFHLFRYLDEQAVRFNERKNNDAGRFVKVVNGIVGKGLKCAKLIAAEGGDGPHPETWQPA